MLAQAASEAGRFAPAAEAAPRIAERVEQCAAVETPLQRGDERLEHRGVGAREGDLGLLGDLVLHGGFAGHARRHRTGGCTRPARSSAARCPRTALSVTCSSPARRSPCARRRAERRARSGGAG